MDRGAYDRVTQRDLLERVEQLTQELQAVRDAADTYFYSMTKENYVRLGEVLRRG
jgi:hypothetical protein